MNFYTTPPLLRRLTPSVAWKLPCAEKVLYLTFDDGPHTLYTPQVLKSLGEWGAAASFFVIGRKAEALPQLVAEVAAAGNTIGNHTYTHLRLWLKSRHCVEQEMTAADSVLQEILGITPRYFRPPHGIFTPGVVRAAHRSGKTLLMWTVNSYDFSHRLDQRTVISRIASQVRPGDIVLLHDGTPLGGRTARLLDTLLPLLQDSGYRFAALPAAGDLRI